MDRDTALAIIKAHEDELRALGARGMALFGSVARDEAGADSDVDVAVRLAEGGGGFALFGRLERIRDRLTDLLGVPVDAVPEPTRPGRIKDAIERDRCVAF